MSNAESAFQETITLKQAKALIQSLASRQSLLLLSPPGVGKSDIVAQAAKEAKLPCRSLLGTQIAPEDVSGVPRIVGERSVFCPPRILLPEKPEPFCLFLDELPACSPDIQKAFYALLLERRLGEHALPPGTWVVAAGNRTTDKALVRQISSALVNRVLILHVRVDFDEWLEWATANGIRREVRDYLKLMPDSLMRPVPNEPLPFSTPRAWASLAMALDRAEKAGVLTPEIRAALAHGRVTAKDAAAFLEFCGQRPMENGQPNPALERLLNQSLAELELSVRATNCLESEGIDNVRGLVVQTEDQLQEIRNFGATTLNEVKTKLAELGLSLGMKVPVTPDLRGRLAGVMHEAERTPANVALTLSQAKSLVQCLSDEQSLLLLSAPGVGKSDIVHQAAADQNLPCRSLLGTQIAPEDVSGVPRIIGERSVFCPPRILLPEHPEPFVLFLDELPACSPDIQKAFYALLLERRLGEHPLPDGTWVVAAGNRTTDKALVRQISSALINRVFVINVRVDTKEWLAWAQRHQVRGDIQSFISFMPEALMRPVPAEPIPFSTPRAWAALSDALDLAEKADLLDGPIRRALAFGRVSAEDAAIYCAMAEESIANLLSLEEYIRDPSKLPTDDTARWFVFCRIRNLVQRGEMKKYSKEEVHHFLMAVPTEHRFALMVDLPKEWGELGAADAFRAALKEVTGI
jgi:MoxR-like ATPase